MAKKVVWTQKAQLERVEILSYWFEKNKTKTYSIKLNKLFVETLKTLAKQPSLGRKTDAANVRVKVVRDYLLFYETSETELIILAIWDGRRNPAQFKI